MENLINYSSFRKNLTDYLNKVTNDHVPTIITRKSQENCVLISESDYSSLKETLYLLSSENNSKRLRDSIEEYKLGKFTERESFNED